MPEVAGSFYSTPKRSTGASFLTTPQIPLLQLAEQTGMSPAELADNLEELMAQGYLRPLSIGDDGMAVAWSITLTPGGGAR